MSEQNAPYRCIDCNVAYVKLWRGYNSFNVELRCRRCTLEHEGYVGIELNDDGSSVLRREDEEAPMFTCPTDSIGWSVPAVPTEDNTTYWGYTSVPQGERS